MSDINQENVNHTDSLTIEYLQAFLMFQKKLKKKPWIGLTVHKSSNACITQLLSIGK